MTNQQNAYFEAFRRMKQFGDTYESQFPENSPARRAFGTLATILTASTQDAAASITNAREGAVQKRTARRALVFRLDAIARTARVIGETVSGFEERFVSPRPSTDRVVLATAHGFVKEAAPVAAQLIANGLPDDFLTGLTDALAAYERATAAHNAGKLARASASAGVAAAIRVGMKAVRAIDVVIRYQFADNAEMQAAWRRAKRLSGLPQPKNPVAAPTPNPVTKSADASTSTQDVTKGKEDDKAA